MITSPEVLFKLLRIALGNETCFSLPNVIDWKELIALSYQQEVAAIAVDGLQKIYDAVPGIHLNLDSKNLETEKYEWFCHSITIEQDYNCCLTAIEDLAKFYHINGIQLMLLKGYGLSLNYPVPAHRQSGDIDIYLWDSWQLADMLVEKYLNISIDNSHHHHSVFRFCNRLVENHYNFVNVYSHFSNIDIESLFKGLAEDKSLAVEHALPNGIKIFFPSYDLNALFLARHCAIHFASERMILRQLLDWTLFVNLHHSDINWDLFWMETEKIGMEKFVLSINAIAVEHLGFDVSIFHLPKKYANFSNQNRALVNQILEDIIHIGHIEERGSGVREYINRFKRWWHNRWKHRIVYKDSLISTFFAQIISHLMKPASIKG